jgi:hypothetical protein
MNPIARSSLRKVGDLVAAGIDPKAPPTQTFGRPFFIRWKFETDETSVRNCYSMLYLCGRQRKSELGLASCIPALKELVTVTSAN